MPFESLIDKNENVLFDNNSFIKYVNDYFTMVYKYYEKKISFDDYIKLYTERNIPTETDEFRKNKVIKNLEKFIEYKITPYKVEMIHKYKRNVEYDRRYIDMFDFLKRVVVFCEQMRLNLPETSIYVFMSDRHPFELDNIGIKFPFFCFATPKNKLYPLLPDVTFQCFSLSKRFGEDCVDWKALKHIIEKNLLPISDDRIYFKGFNNSYTRAGCRELFVKEQNKKYMNIEILSDTTPFESVYMASKYKYLIDVPGRYEWSNRFYKLLLMKRVVFKYMNTIIEYPEDDEFIAFCDLFLKQGRDYIQLDAKLHILNVLNDDMNVLNDDMKREHLKYNAYVIKKDINKLIYITDKLNERPDLYHYIADNGFKRMNALSENHLFIYTYIAILHNARFFSS